MKKILVLIVPILLLGSCVDSLDDFNRDQKRAEVVPAEPLFTNALKSFTDIITTPNVNSNNYRLYVQYWTTTVYLDEPRYILTSRLIPQNFWDAIYRDVLADLAEAKRILNEDQLLDPVIKNNQLAQVSIFEVYAWAALVNTFGNVPYSEALDPLKPLPVYDDAQTIYADLFRRLDEALAMITPTERGFGAGERLYGTGATAMANWVKFGNSVKLKLAMIVADVPALNPAQRVQEAVNGGVISSYAERARFQYIADPPNNNPISANLNTIFTQRQDFVVADKIVNLMDALEDPRMPAYFTQVNGNYVGGKYGLTGNNYNNSSRPNPTIIDPTFEALLIDHAEVEFYLAEAVERGFITGDAETYYNRGIMASFRYWLGPDAGTEEYLNSYLAANPAADYETAPGDWKQKIGTQKYIALFNRGWDAWIEWRRLDAPELVPPSGAGVPTDLVIPRRMIYPINEQTLNKGNREAAASAIGGDDAGTKLFWDVN